MVASRAVVRDLRRINRGTLLRLLFLDGPLNRVELGRLTGLSSGSVTNLCSAMLAERLIIETGQEQSDGGRPRVRLDVNPEFGGLIGVEIGEMGIRVEGFDFTLRPAGEVRVDLRPKDAEPSATIDAIIAAIKELSAQFAASGRPLIGVGIATPGIVAHDEGGAEVHAVNLDWQALPLEALVHERIGAPVFVENGAKALGQAEMWLGAGRGVQNAVVTLWGNGVGAAIFVDGALYRGATSSAGEWGHTCIVAGGRRCRCGSHGCLEAYIGGEWLLEAWREVDPLAPAGPARETDWADQMLEAAASRPEASQILDRAAFHFGVAAANLANLFNPELIVVGGVLGRRFGPALLERIRDVMADQALDYAAGAVELALGRLGADAVTLGASTLVVAELLAGGGTLPTDPTPQPQRATLLR